MTNADAIVHRSIYQGFAYIAWGPLWFGTELGGDPYMKAPLVLTLAAIVVRWLLCRRTRLLGWNHAAPRYEKNRRCFFNWITPAKVGIANAILSPNRPRRPL